MRFPTIHSMEELHQLILEVGFLPFFQNTIPGFFYKVKELCNYKMGGNKGFDTIITRLQMETYITIDTFEYKKDKSGQKYGWGGCQIYNA